MTILGTINVSCQAKVTKLDSKILERGFRIVEERKKLGLTQEKVAEKCGVSRKQWIRYEKDEQKLDGEVLKRFIAIGADGQYILGGVRSDNVQLDRTQRMLEKAKAFDGTPMEKQMQEFIDSALEVQVEEAIRIKQLREKRKSRYANLLRAFDVMPDEDFDHLEKMAEYIYETVLKKQAKQ